MVVIIIFFSYPRTLSELKPDYFTMSMYKRVDSLENKYPSKNFSIYTCAKEYSATYNASTFSTLFLLELRHKFDENGLPIGIQEDCDLPKGADRENEIVNFSNVSKSDILKAGWTTVSFAQMYDSYARWWFKLKP